MFEIGQSVLVAMERGSAYATSWRRKLTPGTVKAVQTSARKRKTGPGTWDMVEVVQSYSVEVTITDLSGQQRATTITVKPHSVRPRVELA